MNKSTNDLSAVLDELTQAARTRGLNDSKWASRAGLRKETLSRLRRRQSCDFATLRALAEAVDSRVGAIDLSAPATSADGHFPVQMDRHYEQVLLKLCASHSLDPMRWAGSGPRFFVAGLAVMLASVSGFERHRQLALAEKLHPGVSEPAVFAYWLERSPLRPSRFLPMLEMEAKHAA